MKRFAKIFSLIMVLALSLAIAACGKKVTIELSQTELTVVAGETATITATVENSEEAVTWTSSDEGVATISGDNTGTITGVKPGSAVITATIGKISITATVTVTTSKAELAANEVTAKIQALPAAAKIKSSDKATVDAVDAAFKALSDAAKAFVKEADQKKLRDCLAAVDNHIAAEAVEALIAALPEAEAVTFENEDVINAAAQAFENLTPAAQGFVSAENQDKLADCRDALEEALATDAAYHQKAANIDTKIAAIGDVAEITTANIDDMETKVIEARTAYDALIDIIKGYVTMLPQLEALEARVVVVKAEVSKAVIDAANVDALIASIPEEPTLADKAVITATRMAYDLLSEYAKSLVANYDTLKGYETIITNREAAKVINDQIEALPDADSVTATDEAAITAARAAFDAASADVKQYFTQEKRLILIEEGLAYVKDPVAATIAYLHKIYDSAYLTHNGLLLAKYKATDITYAYPESAANQDYYDIATGKILKPTPYDFVQTTITATVGTSTTDITFNLGIRGSENHKIIYTTGAASTTGTDIKDGGGTYEQMLAALGFDGLAIEVVSEEDASYAGVVGNVYLAGLNAVINLDETSDPDNDGYIEVAELRTIGDLTREGVQYFLNCGIVGGEPTAYKGSFFVYHNTSNKTFTLNPGWLYGRDNANNYGYTKIIFAPNGDGTYYLKNDIGGSTNGTNTIPKGVTAAKNDDGTDMKDANGNLVLIDDRSYTVDLEPDEYIICSHTYNTSASNGDMFCGRTGMLQAGVVLRFIEYTTDAPQSIAVAATDEQDITQTLATSQVQLGATLEPVFASQEVTWTSSDEAVATVDANGLVTKLTNGKVTITATSTLDASFKASVDLVFHDGVTPTLALDTTEKEAQITDTFTITPTVDPAAYAANIVWTSSDDAVATVDANGLVTIMGVGSATITATITIMKADLSYTDLTATCTVTGTVITEHNNILIDATAVESDVKINGKYQYTYGTNLFSDLTEGMAKAVEGGTVYIAAGTYTAAAAVPVSVNSLTISGIDIASEYAKDYTFDPEATHSLLKDVIFSVADGVTGLDFIGLAFDNKSQITGAGTNSDITIENCIFNALKTLKPMEGVNDGSLFFNNGTDIKFLNNAFTGAFQSPRIFRFNTGEDVTVSGNIFTDSYGWTDDFGSMDVLRVEGSANGDWIITDNIFQKAHQSAIMLRSNGASDVLIQNNYFNSVAAALWTRRYTGVTNILVIGNFFTGNAGGCDVVGSEAGTNFIVRYNYFDNITYAPDKAATCGLICNNKNSKYLFEGVETYVNASNNVINPEYTGNKSSSGDTTIEATLASFEGINFVTGSTFSALALGGQTVTAYESLEAAAAALAAESEITMFAGVKIPTTKLTAKYAITSVFQDIPVIGHESAYASSQAPAIKNLLNLNADASSTTIQNMAITDEGRILVTGGNQSVPGPTFNNLYGHDNTWEPNVAYGKDVLATGSNYVSSKFAMISAQSGFIWVKDTTVTNCEFANINGAGVLIACAENATFTGNVFDHLTCDGIRLSYSSGVGGTYLFDGNTFKDIDYCGIYFRNITGSWTPGATINVTNNTFDSVAKKASESSTVGLNVGCISSSGYGEKQDVAITVKFNTFGLCGGYLAIRDNVTKVDTFAKTFTTDVEYNSFKVAAANTKISTSWFGSDNATTNKGDFTFNHNYIYTEDAEGTKTTVTATYDAILEGSNATAYNSMDELNTAIAALSA